MGANLVNKIDCELDDFVILTFTAAFIGKD